MQSQSYSYLHRVALSLVCTALFVATMVPPPAVAQLAAPPSDSSHGIDTAAATWATAFALREHVLEHRYGILFDAFWVPRVTFGTPAFTERSQAMYSDAWYEPSTQSFLLNPSLRSEPVDLARIACDTVVGEAFLSQRYKLRELVDHELGHVLSDQLSRRFGYGAFMSMAEWDALPWDEKVGKKILVEGIATYFGNTSVAREWPDLRALLPQSRTDYVWQCCDQWIIYDGGQWLVRPILERFGERGLGYLLGHPFTFLDGDVHTAAIEYQSQALKELGGK